MVARRTFVVVGHETPTEPSFSLDDLPGAGRLDVLCRCVTAAFVLSHDIRTDVTLHLVVSGEYVVTFDGSELRRLNPDERSTAALIRTALEARDRAIGAMAAEPAPGVAIRKGGLETALEAAGDSESTPFVLQRNGDPVIEVDPPTHPVFVLSDHRSFTDDERDLLAERTRSVSIGPRTVHGDDAITVVHNWLDTDGFSRY
ncbi:MAG: tRNA (pseudouridine(54)-N(1))-methyltransferase TrmY [Natronomonas sp.]